MAPAVSDSTAVMPRRRTSRRVTSGRLPETLPGSGFRGGAHFSTIHNRPRPPRPYERTDGDVLALLAVAPRDLFEVARALDIHTALASAALDSLTRQGRAVVIPGHPKRWEAA